MDYISSTKEFKEYLRIISENITLKLGDQITFKEFSEINSLKHYDYNFFGVTPTMKEIIEKRQVHVVSEITTSNAGLLAFKLTRVVDSNQWIYSPTWIETLNGVSIEDIIDGTSPRSETQISCNIDFNSLFQ